ncbi:nitrite reductase small subunit NirD [Azoarcus olearius]|uniref:Nitrite reductase small subunit, probable n=1 Tax=Azoarcus sp. (strain BH72) TaxID=418699 RepID=A1K4N8_AZOSB|nr:nitrite reductase small subunit NirD [Azoarcus olearius]ANQ84343.1 nitrite reductase small subunit [Azoarcus olearius]CAL93793.1 nitrite reductase small subunit, probable [Azoarcus olearius]
MTTETLNWTAVCKVGDILPGTGVCALVDERHVAVFRLGKDNFYAIDNIDPRSGVSVLSRGLIGNLGEHIVVASPIYKNHFDLRTGACLEAPEHSVRAHRVQISGDDVLVALG